MIRLLAVALLVACSGRAPAPTGPGGTGRAAVPADGGGSAIAPEGDAATTSAPHPSAEECDALVAHALTLELAARPPDHQLGEAELAPIRTTLRARHAAECQALSREAYRCALAAERVDDLIACGATQATRSSSTSNSSVAPGGITPAAPRSP